MLASVVSVLDWRRVVALVVAAQRELGAGHGLVGADVLGVERRRPAGQRDVLGADHAGQRATRDVGVAVAVVDLVGRREVAGQRLAP